MSTAASHFEGTNYQRLSVGAVRELHKKFMTRIEKQVAKALPKDTEIQGGGQGRPS